jgi:hypothetical protein
MKTILLTIALLTSQVTFAAIKNSNNEPRHQALIEAAIQDKCGSFYDITQYSQTETAVRIDNGIVDVKFVTVMYGKSRLDQYIFDEYKLTVESEKSDMYDHATGNWGAYSITAVSCAQN